MKGILNSSKTVEDSKAGKSKNSILQGLLMNLLYIWPNFWAKKDKAKTSIAPYACFGSINA